MVYILACFFFGIFIYFSPEFPEIAFLIFIIISGLETPFYQIFIPVYVAQHTNVLNRNLAAGNGDFFDLPQNRGADRQQNVFHCIDANFYPFLTLVTYFFQEFFELLKNEKILKF